MQLVQAHALPNLNGEAIGCKALSKSAVSVAPKPPPLPSPMITRAKKHLPQGVAKCGYQQMVALSPALSYTPTVLIPNLSPQCNLPYCTPFGSGKAPMAF